MAKARLGFRAGSTDPCRGWAGGWEELEETASVVMPKCLGAGGGLGQGREQEKSNDAGGPPLPGLPGLGDCHLWSMLRVCSPVTVLSHLLGVGRGRKSAPWSWLPEERAGKEAVGRPQGERNLLVYWKLKDAYPSSSWFLIPL